MPDFPTSGYPPMIGRVLSVAEWRSYIASYDFGPIAPTRLVLHHTYRPDETQWRGLASMRGMQGYYAGLGWSAAPHIYVAPDGIWLFTPMREVGIHAGLGNQGITNSTWWYSIGLEMVGYFDYNRPSGNVWEYAKEVMVGVAQRLNIAPRRLISFHRDYTSEKSCPGWAVTHEWVYAEVEAAMNRTAPPPPAPVPPPGKPTPANEAIFERLLNEAYQQRGAGYEPSWAFHQFAVENFIGLPLGASKRLEHAGREYNYQPFSDDTIYTEVPNWGTVLRLNDLLLGSIPPDGLGRDMLEATYRDMGQRFRADAPAYQYALAAGFGLPLAGVTTVTVDGTAYEMQPFAHDTLYWKANTPQDIQELNLLAATTDPARVRLREALLAQTYASMGQVYHPEWSFHQLARKWRLGTPLSSAYVVEIEGTQYNLQVYATDALYNVIPQWQDVRQLSLLSSSVAGFVLGATSTQSSSTLRDDTVYALPQPPYPLLHYTSTPPVSAYSQRYGSRVALLVLHGDPDGESITLPHMSAIGARDTTHYYITLTGTVYRLVADKYAARHAGMGDFRGRRQNINRISIGVVLARPAGIDPHSTKLDLQRNALGWLLHTLAQQYDLPADAAVRWLDFAPQVDNPHSRQPLDDLTAPVLAAMVLGQYPDT